jgi:pimeloyl-ACP methyl ester carboxylesterase
VTGAARGRVLMLLHSGGADEDGWDFVPLGDLGLHLVRHALPGHGGRPRWPKATIEDLADEVAEAAPEGADLLGAAFGGMVALHALARHPDRFRSAVLTCTAPSMADRREVLLARARAAEEDGVETVVQQSIERWFTGDAIARRPQVVGYAAATLAGMDPAAFADLWRWMAGHDMSPASLASIAHPVTLVAAREDAALGVEGMELLARYLSSSRLEVVTGPHLLHLERPDVIRHAVVAHYEWLGALDL